MALQAPNPYSLLQHTYTHTDLCLQFACTWFNY